ncbi:GntR family transcriptional regulator [Ornithinimicrobium faecis]|uniref:GntR family transcriptional regulator n=1 Tax=Ornithinimicrobium faecis TaxID=2934158 RepID=A0ABY4YWX0_9MICO|nr:GntR family transcriptional regulator [Ornithinimicrobium sp. HY1793]USQ81256.1 GntR family transcriptional regulator [Ornithinimicrobium sp. HY1793]
MVPDDTGAQLTTLAVDPASSEPPFAQLRTQIANQVASGALKAGDRLPTVRQLAGDLGIAANTVARAYRELEADGLVEGRGRAGTFVMGRSGPEEAADAAASLYARTVAGLGLDPAEALAIVRRALRA